MTDLTDQSHHENNPQREMIEAAAFIFIIGTIISGMAFSMALLVVPGIFAIGGDSSLTGSDFNDLMAYVWPLLCIFGIAQIAISVWLFLRVRAGILRKHQA